MPETPDLTPAFLEEIDQALLPLRERFEQWLGTLEGRNEGSFEANRRLAVLIQEAATRMNVAFACTKAGCGQPSKLRCTKTPAVSSGMFTFQHDRHTHGGGSTFPSLTIVPRAPDKRRRLETEL